MTTVTVNANALRTVLDALNYDADLNALRASDRLPGTTSAIEILTAQLNRGVSKQPITNKLTRDELPIGPSRNHLLTEAATRADYFYRQTNGTYEFPVYDGQTSQLIGMLLAAANKPVDSDAGVSFLEAALEQCHDKLSDCGLHYSKAAINARTALSARRNQEPSHDNQGGEA